MNPQLTNEAIDAGRAAEVAAKLRLLREALAEGVDGSHAGAIRLRGADWFAWATGGAEASPLLADGPDGAELLVTADEACVLADAVEAERLRGAGLPDGFTFHIAPWAEPELHDRYVLGAAGGGIVLSDRPQRAEDALPHSLRLRRTALSADEQERLRQLGRDAAAAVGDALRAARPGWTEYALGAAAAQALMQRGIQPAMVLAAGARRMPLQRRPAPTAELLGSRALLAVSARRHGLHANLVRCVSFGPLPDDLRLEHQALLQVEATGLDAVRPGQSLAAVIHALDAAYRHADRTDALQASHQGGITGYLPYEMLASPSTATGIETGMAFAFAPGLPGIAVQDTFLLGAGGLDNLTADPAWPSTTIGGRVRPLWLEAAP
ncbi:M24 family metallopeptidase [Massilia sp. TN1-12]|uniref:M24 family metallopeptidase n=1 Tax=Massilia paldalensis TaxID=3377675 RepID=UPI00384DF6CE